MLEAVEKQVSPGETKRTQYQRIVSYGVAVLLSSVSDWLDELAPVDEDSDADGWSDSPE